MIIDEKRSFKDKIEDVGKEAKRKVKNAGRWIAEHPEEAITMTAGVLTAVGACAVGCTKLIGKVEQIKDRRDERCRIWDPSMGVYWYSKKPLTATQKIEFEGRVNNGENRGQILSDMGVLNRRR